ncbi:MAG TPA: hypothetical protein VFV38_14705 [Ktedonobacteraceae bacterium]|nr:hypothetical protein [Ktedonobacteraceae bacterium]
MQAQSKKTSSVLVFFITLVCGIILWSILLFLLTSVFPLPSDLVSIIGSVSFFVVIGIALFIVYLIGEQKEFQERGEARKQKEQEHHAKYDALRRMFNLSMTDNEIASAMYFKKHPFDTPETLFRANRVFWSPKEMQKEYGPFWDRDYLPISGPPQFRQTVERVLQELREKAPHRYLQAIRYLPKAEYTTDSQHSYFAGRSDGLFTLDGSGDIPGHKRNDYDTFRHTFLHEVGHCFYIHSPMNSHSEDWANIYADDVLKELEAH